MSIKTPQEIVRELDKHIIGQDQAKRSVAIALRNRWRRMEIEDDELRNEIMPKNILMIGPTGVGKQKLLAAWHVLLMLPLLKWEATKFTEVGYVGRDVESIIRDLVDISVKRAREEDMTKVEHRARESAENRVLDILLPPLDKPSEEIKTPNTARERFKEKLCAGELDEQEIEINLPVSAIGVEIMTPPGLEEMASQLQSLFQNVSSDKTKTRKMKVKKALQMLREEEAAKLINEEDVKIRALDNVEQNGIVFIDELDKVAKRSEHTSGADVSREGVQRDLLPLVEGCTVGTKYGMIKTDHILFMASGAFHAAKPSDLIAELQGRFPIRVELSALSTKDFVRILTEPSASLTTQYIALMKTENVKLKFSKDGIQRIAEVAWQVNEKTENIGARRLYTVMERLLETISFEATERGGDTIRVNKDYVNKYLAELLGNEDLARYIL